MPDDDDPFDSEEWEAYAARARKELFPKLDASSMGISLCPAGGKWDVRFCLELGAMIMRDIPLIVIMTEQGDPPPKLEAVADLVIRLEDGEMLTDEHVQERLAPEIHRVLAKYGIGKFGKR